MSASYIVSDVEIFTHVCRMIYRMYVMCTLDGCGCVVRKELLVARGRERVVSETDQRVEVHTDASFGYSLFALYRSTPYPSIIRLQGRVVAALPCGESVRPIYLKLSEISGCCLLLQLRFEAPVKSFLNPRLGCRAQLFGLAYQRGKLSQEEEASEKVRKKTKAPPAAVCSKTVSIY